MQGIPEKCFYIVSLMRPQIWAPLHWSKGTEQLLTFLMTHGSNTHIWWTASYWHLLKDQTAWVACWLPERVIDDWKRKTLQGQKKGKKKKKETRERSVLSESMGRNKGENHHSESKTRNPLWRRHQLVHYHLSPPSTFHTDRWSFVSRLNNEHRIFYFFFNSKLIFFKWLE